MATVGAGADGTSVVGWAISCDRKPNLTLIWRPSLDPKVLDSAHCRPDIEMIAEHLVIFGPKIGQSNQAFTTAIDRPSLAYLGDLLGLAEPCTLPLPKKWWLPHHEWGNVIYIIFVRFRGILMLDIPMEQVYDAATFVQLPLLYWNPLI